MSTQDLADSLDELISYWDEKNKDLPADQRIKVEPQVALYLHLVKVKDKEGLKIFLDTKHPSVRQSLQQGAEAVWKR